MGLGRSLYFSGMGSLLRFVLQFGLSIFVARMLTPEEIGSFGVALAAAAFVRAFESAGINNFVASHKDIDRPMMRSVFSVNAVLNAFIALALWALSGPLALFFGSETVAQILKIAAVATLLNTHLPIERGLLRRQMRFKALMVLDLVLAVIGGTTTIAAIMAGYGPLAMAFALVTEKIGGILIGFIAFRRDIPMLPSFQHAKTVLNYGLSLSAATVIGMVGAHSGNFVLGKLLGLAPSAQFDRAMTLPRLIWTIVLPSFHNVLVPSIARHRDKPEARRMAMENTILLFTIILWPAAIVLALVGADVVITLFGEQWWQAASLTPFFVIYSTIASPVTLACSGLVAMGQGSAMVKIQIAEQGTKVLVLLCAFFVGLPALGKLMAIPYAIYIAVSMRYLVRHNLLDLKQVIQNLLRPLRLAAICALPVFGGRYLIGFDAYFTAEQLAALAAVCAIAFLAALKMIEPDILDRALEVVGVKKGSGTEREKRL